MELETLISGFLIGLLLLGILGGSILIENWEERENCRLMAKSDFKTQIRTKMIVVKDCYVFDEGLQKFVPYEKFRAFG